MVLQHTLEFGQVTYNGFNFPPALNSSAQCTPVYDDTDRSIMYMLYNFRIEFIVNLAEVSTYGDGTINANPVLDSAGNNDNRKDRSIDLSMEWLRRRLTQPGRTLHIKDIGIGPDLIVNDSNQGLKYWDVNWGPKPKMVEWQPLGLNKAARVVWQVEVAIVQCEDKYQGTLKEGRQDDNQGVHLAPFANGTLPFNILQISYNQTWDINHAGLTTKNYEAIIQTRGQVDPIDLREVIDSADHYRIFFEPALQPGFLRTRNYRLDKAKTKLEITIQDSEVESDFPYPPGVVEIDVDYQIGSSLLGSNPFTGGPAGFNVWTAQMGGSFTLAKGFHPHWRKIYPYYLIIQLIRTRFIPGPAFETSYISSTGESMKSMVDTGDTDSVEKKPNGTVIPLKFNMSESMFGRSFGFNFEWGVVQPPQKAVAALRFGFPSNEFADLASASASGATSQVIWSWDMWMTSVYGDGTDSLNSTWDNYYLTAPLRYWKSAPTKEGKLAGQGQWVSKNIPVLSSWKTHGAAMSNRGNVRASFEGDQRFEPCQDNFDFWYGRTQQGFSATGTTPTPNFNGSIDPDNRILDFNFDISIVQNNHVIMHSTINDGNNTVSNNQDANSLTLAANAAAATASQEPFNPVEVVITSGSSEADIPQVNSVSPSFEVIVTGKCTAAGKPAPLPEFKKFGEAELIALIKDSKVKPLSQASDPSIYLTAFKMKYACQGSPSVPAGDSIMDHIHGTLGESVF
jgi:hypothetical protein